MAAPRTPLAIGNLCLRGCRAAPAGRPHLGNCRYRPGHPNRLRPAAPAPWRRREPHSPSATCASAAVARPPPGAHASATAATGPAARALAAAATGPATRTASGLAAPPDGGAANPTRHRQPVPRRLSRGPRRAPAPRRLPLPVHQPERRPSWPGRTVACREPHPPPVATDCSRRAAPAAPAGAATPTGPAARAANRDAWRVPRVTGGPTRRRGSGPPPGPPAACGSGPPREGNPGLDP
ncbi:hypothetical protein SAMN05421835_105277 [Amycolatopsis sacchari]|uniref:Uncharacterized protein n=1 Tax=Amycolatopsis sacchari TaxID=115433 RepID=A0A1I3RDS0_9PSEU|nr:hypothetical protein SAMN05421835_105277 [Amycolatopsis sacchari]